MPELITAPITREIVSYSLARCQDENRTIFPNDNEVFDYINTVVRELTRFSKILKTNLYIPLIPNQLDYNYLKVVDILTNIVQIETVSLVDASDVESAPLAYRNKKDYRNNIITNTSITTPTYYNYDGVIISYWRPVTSNGQRLKLKVSRELLSSEEVNKDTDPPQELTTKFLSYIKYGVVKEMALSRPDNKTLSPIVSTYDRLFNGYKEVELIPKTLDSHRTYMEEF